MSVLVTKPAPDFTATAVMPDNSFDENFTLSSFRGKSYVVLFFYPLDFTFVCPSELIAFDNRIEKFKEHNVQVIGCSVDSHFSHLAWRNTPSTRAASARSAIRSSPTSPRASRATTTCWSTRRSRCAAPS